MVKRVLVSSRLALLTGSLLAGSLLAIPAFADETHDPLSRAIATVESQPDSHVLAIHQDQSDINRFTVVASEGGRLSHLAVDMNHGTLRPARGAAKQDEAALQNLHESAIPQIALSDAVKTAEHIADAPAVGAELVASGGVANYRIELADATGAKHTVVIDAHTGQMISDQLTSS